MDCKYCDKRTTKLITLVIPPAKDKFQEIFRKTCAKTFALSEECHCLVCGETQTESLFFKGYLIAYKLENKSIVHLCNFCSMKARNYGFKFIL